MEKKDPTPPPEKEEKKSIYSFKNLFIRLLCIVCLSYGVKTLISRRQTIYAGLVGLVLALFIFSFILFLVRVFQEDNQS